MSADTLNVILATLPPLVVLILMVGFRWGGSKAGPAGWVVALVIAALRFGAGVDVMLWAHVRALVLTIDVVLIVWMALLLYFVVREAGALDVIARWFSALTGDDVLRVLLLGWVFTSFLQGVGGFGVPVAVVAPLLVGLGLPALAAVVVPSLGHAWAVTFGSLGSSFIALTGVTGLDADFLAPPAAILLGFGAVACGIAAAYVYGRGRGLRRALPAILFIGVMMAVVQYIAATNGLWNIASACGGLAGLAAGLWVTRWGLYKRVTSEVALPEPDPNAPSFPLAISGYLILVVLAVVIIGIAPIKGFLGQVRPSVDVPQVQTSLGWVTEATSGLGLPILAHTGSVLLLQRPAGLCPLPLERPLQGWRNRSHSARSLAERRQTRPGHPLDGGDGPGDAGRWHDARDCGMAGRGRPATALRFRQRDHRQSGRFHDRQQHQLQRGLRRAANGYCPTDGPQRGDGPGDPDRLGSDFEPDGPGQDSGRREHCRHQRRRGHRPAQSAALRWPADPADRRAGLHLLTTGLLSSRFQRLNSISHPTLAQAGSVLPDSALRLVCLFRQHML